VGTSGTARAEYTKLQRQSAYSQWCVSPQNPVALLMKAVVWYLLTWLSANCIRRLPPPFCTCGFVVPGWVRQANSLFLRALGYRRTAEFNVAGVGTWGAHAGCRPQHLTIILASANVQRDVQSAVGGNPHPRVLPLCSSNSAATQRLWLKQDSRNMRTYDHTHVHAVRALVWEEGGGGGGGGVGLARSVLRCLRASSCEMWRRRLPPPPPALALTCASQTWTRSPTW
jgi:hypothetical protein